MKHDTKKAIREWIESLVGAFILAMILRTFVIEAMKIPTGSMEPTLHGIIATCKTCGSNYSGTDYTDKKNKKRCPKDRRRLKVIQQGDRIFVNKFIYKFKAPERGDIVVFRPPHEPKKNFVKRLIAVGGEDVEIKEGRIYVNGKAVDDNPNPIGKIYYYNRGEYGREEVKIRVPEGYLFVLGDNSANSHDSRYWGFVPKKNLIGKTFLIFWPPNRLRIAK